jgi:hypothetical protein
MGVDPLMMMLMWHDDDDDDDKVLNKISVDRVFVVTKVDCLIVSISL